MGNFLVEKFLRISRICLIASFLREISNLGCGWPHWPHQPPEPAPEVPVIRQNFICEISAKISRHTVRARKPAVFFPCADESGRREVFSADESRRLPLLSSAAEAWWRHDSWCARSAGLCYGIKTNLPGYKSSSSSAICKDCESDLKQYADECLEGVAQDVDLQEACGAMIIGIPLLSIILAVLVALASVGLMN